MTETLAFELAARRMKDRGIGTEYYTYFGHYVLQPNASMEIDAYNQLFILLDDVSDISIASDFGFYDLSDLTANELNHEHSGSIFINNYSATITHIKFLQIIPKN
jgi:hypothetical protein